MMADFKTITLDPHFLTLLLAIGSLCIAFFQLLAARLHKKPIGHALRLCAGSFALMATGQLLTLAVHILPDLFTKAVSNTLVLASIAGYYLAVQALRQEKPHSPYCLAVLCANFLLYCCFFYAVPNLPIRLVVLILSLIAVLLPLCRALFIGIRSDQRVIWWTTGVLFAFMLIMLVSRIGLILINYHAYRQVLDGHLLPWILVKSSFLVTIVAGFFFVLMAIDEVAFQNARLATLDSLTSIYNRRAFDELAGRSLVNSSKSGKTSSLLTLDLDHFKAINDKHGHTVGDVVLKEITRAIALQLRGKDIFARSGGEEFSILLPDTTAREAIIVAERLRQVVQELNVKVSGFTLPLTVSIGVAANPDQSKDLKMLATESDWALYQAKSQGRNRVVMA